MNLPRSSKTRFPRIWDERASEKLVYRCCGAGGVGNMFVFTKRSGERGRARFYWWPLILSLVASVVLTLLVNAAIR